MGSLAFELDLNDLKSIGKGAAIAAAGAVATYLQQVGLTFDQNTIQGAILFVVCSTAVNLIRKFVFPQG